MGLRRKLMGKYLWVTVDFQFHYGYGSPGPVTNNPRLFSLYPMPQHDDPQLRAVLQSSQPPDGHSICRYKRELFVIVERVLLICSRLMCVPAERSSDPAHAGLLQVPHSGLVWYVASQPRIVACTLSLFFNSKLTCVVLVFCCVGVGTSCPSVVKFVHRLTGDNTPYLHDFK